MFRKLGVLMAEFEFEKVETGHILELIQDLNRPEIRKNGAWQAVLDGLFALMESRNTIKGGTDGK